MFVSHFFFNFLTVMVEVMNMYVRTYFKVQSHNNHLNIFSLFWSNPNIAIQNTKHNTIQGNVKKINYIPTKRGTNWL